MRNASAASIFMSNEEENNEKYQDAWNSTEIDMREKKKNATVVVREKTA